MEETKIEVTLHEGGKWVDAYYTEPIIELENCLDVRLNLRPGGNHIYITNITMTERSVANFGMYIHSARFPDGREWDTVNGWHIGIVWPEEAEHDIAELLLNRIKLLNPDSLGRINIPLAWARGAAIHILELRRQLGYYQKSSE